MSTTKHTPGPWSVMSEWPEELDGYEHHCVVGADNEPLTDYPANEADIVLMAAAPELLAALELLVDNPYREGTESDERLRRIALAAIAKAKGES